MDNKTDIKLEAFPSDDDLTIGEHINLANLVGNIKNETATRDNEFEVDSKTNIKIEHNDSEVDLQNEGWCFSTNLETNYETTSNYYLEMDSKIKIKEGSVVSCAELSNEHLECTSFATKIKNDTITDIFKMDNKLVSRIQEFVSDATSQNDECFSFDRTVNIEKEAVICINRGVKRITKPESQCQSAVVSLSDISQTNETEESDLNKNVMAEDAPLSESPRLNTEASRCDSLGSSLSKATLYDRNGYSLESNKPLEDHASGKIYISDSYLKKEVQNKQGNQSMCDICGTRFSHQSALKMHQLTHERKKPFKDKVYEQQLSSMGQLKNCVEDKPRKWEACDKDFKTSSMFKMHTQTIDSSKSHTFKFNFIQQSNFNMNQLIPECKRSHKCDICNKMFTKLGNLKTHKLIHEGKRPHKCDICDKRFTQLGHLKTHKLVHEGKRSHECCICAKRFTALGDLNRHKLIHEGKKPHKCDICDKTFTHKGNLKMHKLIHEDKKSHRCDICDKTFTHLGSLKRHKLLHEGKRANECDVCHKRFTAVGDLNRHKLIHKGKRTHECCICDKRFTATGGLNRHKLIHEGKKPHKCDICDKNFTYLGNLKAHKLIHEDKEIYRCDICDKWFTHLGRFKIHKLIHEGKKTHKCDICDKIFAHLGNLKTHKLIHEGKKPHKCDVCDKTFTQIGNLKTHKLMHEGKKPYNCDICGKCFSQLGHLKTHIVLIHNVKQLIGTSSEHM